MEKIKVAILGATGTVGQKLISLLADHPWFTITDLIASERSAGKPYHKACAWKQDADIPADLMRKPVIRAGDSQPLNSRIVFSGLDADAAKQIESSYAEAGLLVISNAKSHRMDPLVPLSIPEINPEHFEVIEKQPRKGAIVTNSNCSVMVMAMILAPLERVFGLRWVHVTTMQAITGAGYPGVPSMDILGNVIPYIGGEEEKMEIESQKILGRVVDGKIVSADYRVSAQCNRVPVFDGHTETLSIKFKQKASVGEVKEILRQFKGLPQELKLPSAPAKPIIVFDQDDRPQPARDVWKHRGMSVCVGRIRPCPINDIKMVIMGHNTIRGAAGAAVLNGEALVKLGYLEKLA